jgi:hypothetical protein
MISYRIYDFSFFFKKKPLSLQADCLYLNNVNTFIWKSSKKYLLISNFNFFFLFLKINFLNFFLKNLKNWFLKVNELELKGLNYWFTKLRDNLLLDLGRSHFQMFSYPNEKIFFSLKKKKTKKIFFLGVKKMYFNAMIIFFWYKLKSVGPYKLKGFQFLNERIKLKEGKKPFK